VACHKCNSLLFCLEFADNILIFAVLERWLLQLREIHSSFVLYICGFLGDRLFQCSAVAEMDDRLATIDMGQKEGVVPLSGQVAGSP